MFQIKSGAGKRHPAQKNNPKPDPVEKPSRKVPEWLLFTRKVERGLKAREQMAKTERGSQARPKRGE